MDRGIRLHPSHPYLRHVRVSVIEVGSQWRVKWRDILSTGQDRTFARFSDAQGFARDLRQRLDIVDQDTLDDACMTLEEATAFWGGFR